MQTGLSYDVKLLAYLLNLSRSELNKFEPKYRKIQIPKRTGGVRELIVPDSDTKRMQRVLSRRVFSRYRTHEKCFGFSRGGSTVRNATFHIGKETLINLDIADFFPSTNAYRIFDMLRNRGWTNAAAKAIVQLVCVDNGLPQGAPSSPILSNVVNWSLDMRLDRLATKMGMEYSRYADDLTFSYSNYCRGKNHRLLSAVGQILKDHHYRFNKKKKRILRAHQRQAVTGLVVNEKVNLPRETRLWLRAVYHRMQTCPAQCTLTVQEYKGWLAYLKMANPSALRTVQPFVEEVSEESFPISGMRIHADDIRKRARNVTPKRIRTNGETAHVDETKYGGSVELVHELRLKGKFNPVGIVPFKPEPSAQFTTLNDLGIAPVSNALTPSQYYSAHLLATKGFTSEEVAKERGLKVNTIWKHLAVAVEQGLLRPDKVLQNPPSLAIHDYIRSFNHRSKMRLKDIYHHFDEQYSYDEIRIALAFFRRQRILAAVRQGTRNIFQLLHDLDVKDIEISQVEEKLITFVGVARKASVSELSSGRGKQITVDVRATNGSARIQIEVGLDKADDIGSLVDRQPVLIQGIVKGYEQQNQLLLLQVRHISLTT